MQNISFIICIFLRITNIICIIAYSQTPLLDNFRLKPNNTYYANSYKDFRHNEYKKNINFIPQQSILSNFKSNAYDRYFRNNFKDFQYQEDLKKFRDRLRYRCDIKI